MSSELSIKEINFSINFAHHSNYISSDSDIIFNTKRRSISTYTNGSSKSQDDVITAKRGDYGSLENVSIQNYEPYRSDFTSGDKVEIIQMPTSNPKKPIDIFKPIFREKIIGKRESER